MGRSSSGCTCLRSRSLSRARVGVRAIAIRRSDSSAGVVASIALLPRGHAVEIEPRVQHPPAGALDGCRDRSFAIRGTDYHETSAGARASRLETPGACVPGCPLDGLRRRRGNSGVQSLLLAPVLVHDSRQLAPVPRFDWPGQCGPGILDRVERLDDLLSPLLVGFPYTLVGIRGKV